jgi:hypothetical protein
MQTQVDVRPDDRGATPRGAPLTSGANGSDPVTVERLRPLVLQIIQEELERLHRQQG